MFNFLKEESRRHPEMELAGFIHQIDLLEDHDIKLEVSQVIFNEQGVNFLTCHGSKGLEFDHVFLIGCNSDLWEKKRKPPGKYKLPDTIFRSEEHTSELQSLMRISYAVFCLKKKQQKKK